MVDKSSKKTDSKLRALFDSKPVMAAATIAVVALIGSLTYKTYDSGALNANSKQLAMAGCKSVISNNLRRRQISAYSTDDFKNVYRDIVGVGYNTSFANNYLEIGFNLNDKGMINRVAIADHSGTDDAGYPIIDRTFFNCFTKAEILDFKSNYLWVALQPSDWNNTKAWVQKASNQLGLKNLQIQKMEVLARNKIREPLDNKIEMFYPQYNLVSPKERSEIKRSLIRVLAENYYVKLPLYIDENELSDTLNRFAPRLSKITKDEVKKISHELNVHIALYKGGFEGTEDDQEDELMQLASLSDDEYQIRQRARNIASGAVASFDDGNSFNNDQFTGEEDHLRQNALLQKYKNIKRALTKEELEFLKGPSEADFSLRLVLFMEAVKTMNEQEKRNQLLLNINLENSEYHKAFMSYIGNLEEDAKLMILGYNQEDSIRSLSIIKKIILIIGERDISELNEKDIFLMEGILTNHNDELSNAVIPDSSSPSFENLKKKINNLNYQNSAKQNSNSNDKSFSYLEEELAKKANAQKIISGSVASIRTDIKNSNHNNNQLSNYSTTSLLKKFKSLKNVFNQDELALLKGDEANKANIISLYIGAIKSFKNNKKRQEIIFKIDLNNVAYRRHLSSYIKTLDRQTRKQIMGRSVSDLKQSFKIMSKILSVLDANEIAALNDESTNIIAEIIIN